MQSDASFTTIGRAVPKGDVATCINRNSSDVFVGARSGTLYRVVTGTGNRTVFSKSAQHSTSISSLCVLGEHLVSVDQDSLLVLWSADGTVISSQHIEDDAGENLKLIACDGGVVVVGRKFSFVGVNAAKQHLSAPLVYTGPGTFQNPRSVVHCASHIVFADDRLLYSLRLPTASCTEWTDAAEDLILGSTVSSLSAFVRDGHGLDVAVAFEAGRLALCNFDLGTHTWGPVRMETTAPGSVLAIFHSQKLAVGVFGTFQAPTLSSLKLTATKPSSEARVSSSSRQVKRARDETTSGLVSVASSLPQPKQPRSGAEVQSVSLAERLAAAAGAAAESEASTVSEAGDGYQNGLGTSSVAVPLSQALNSGNDGLLERCLSGATSDTTIISTVRALNGADALLLLNQLMAKFEKRPSRGSALLVWLKSILQVHAGTLMSVPALSDRLLPLYQGVNQRMATFKKLLRLQGRLDLLLSHV